MLATLAPGWSQQVLYGLGTSLHVPALLNLASFVLVGLPLGTILAYQLDLGARGLWLGLLLAMLLVIFGQYAHIYRTINWVEAARLARERSLATEQHGTAEASTPSGERADQQDEEGRGLAGADSAKESIEV